MKTFKPRKIETYRMDIEQSLKELPKKNTIFPYRFQWRAYGREVRRITLVCNENRAVWIDIEYFDNRKKTIVI